MKKALKDIIILILLLLTQLIVWRFWLGEYYFQRGERYRQKNIKLAAEYYKRALSLNSVNSAYHRRLGQAFYAISRESDTPGPWLDKANREFSTAIELVPHNPYFWADLGKVLLLGESLRQRRDRSAEECIAHAVKLDPFNPYFLELNIKYLLANGLVDKADQLIPIFIEILPQRIDKVALPRLKYDNGFDFMEQSLDENAEALYHFATIESSHGRNEKAEFYFLKAISLRPDNDNYKITAAKFYMKNKKFNRALETVEPILNKETTPYLEAYDIAGYVHLIKGNPETAVKIFNRALKIDPGFSPVRLKLADLYYRKGNLEQAKREYTYLVENHKLPKGLRMIVLYKLGDIYFKTGNKEKAREYFMRCLKINPESPEVKNYLKKL